MSNHVAEGRTVVVDGAAACDATERRLTEEPASRGGVGNRCGVSADATGEYPNIPGGATAYTGQASAAVGARTWGEKAGALVDSIADCKIYVVVPVFNRKIYVEQLLRCLRKQKFNNFETVVVDDGSTDGTSELIAEQFKEVKLLHGNGNLWWTGAINLGIRYVLRQASDSDAILIINDDLEFNCDYIETLYGLFKSMPRTLIGSVVVDVENPDFIDEGGVIVNWLTAKYTMLNYKKTLSSFTKDFFVDVSLLSGRGTLIPCRTFREIGLFREDHFQQCGDTEFPVRAKNFGYRLVVSYAAIVKNHLDSSYGMNVSKYYSFKDIKRYFFDVKSNFRLKYRFFFSLDTAKNPFFFVSFLLFDLLRIVCHFLVRLRFSGKIH